MANVAVTLIAAGAGAFAGKILEAKKDGVEKNGEERVAFETDATQNVDHTSAAKAARSIAVAWPSAIERIIIWSISGDAARKAMDVTSTRRPYRCGVNESWLKLAELVRPAPSSAVLGINEPK